jgi:Sulfotransferase domain
VLRDPIERTISHWAEQSRNGVETLPLDEALRREAERVGDDHARLADERIKYSFAHEQQSYAAQSEYAAGLDRWLAHFPRRRTLLLFSEDLYRDPAGTMATVTEFMGLPPFPTIDAMQRNAAPRPATLDAELRARLVERFTPTAERVAELVGRTPPWPWFADQAAATDATVDR